jgi:hypothetical protein
MMNGVEKSDPLVVPAKLANKAEQSAAELVEGSGGTKRNADLQSTVRTRSREAASQAQARIRRAVTGNKKEKRTALLHRVSIDVLRWAFFGLKKRAATGVDGLTWEAYAADLEQNLTDLHAKVHSGDRTREVTPGGVVEGRASPKGNSRQAAVVRTLSRVATSIRLAAVRRIACGLKPRVGRCSTRGRSPVR